MGSLNLANLLKFLAGIMLVQAVTAAVILTAGDLSRPRTWWLLGAVALGIAVFASFWFSSVTRHSSQAAVSRAREDLLREREKLRVRAEKEKTRILERSQRRITRETSQVQAKANFKVGAAFAGALAVGGVMLLTQFFTVGLVLLSGSGGALAGYLTRLRQEARSRAGSGTPGIGGDPAPGRLPPNQSPATGKAALKSLFPRKSPGDT